MLLTQRYDPFSALYFSEALSDLNQLRVIVWPRLAGKSALIGTEVQHFGRQRGFHMLIVHPNKSEADEFAAEYLGELDPEVVTNCVYSQLPTLAEECTNLYQDKKLILYFSEPDLYPASDWGDPYEVLAECIQLLNDHPRVNIQQITYIGTPWYDFSHGQSSTLARICGAVELVHTCHPRQIYPDWQEHVRLLGKVFSTDWIRTQMFGEYL